MIQPGPLVALKGQPTKVQGGARSLASLILGCIRLPLRDTM